MCEETVVQHQERCFHAGMTLSQVRAELGQRGVITAVKRDGEIILDGREVVQEGDTITFLSDHTQ